MLALVPGDPARIRWRLATALVAFALSLVAVLGFD